MKYHAFIFILVSMSMMACNAVSEKSFSAGNSTLISTPATSFNCSYYSQFDSLSDCQTSTGANCDWSWKVFPTGGTSLCYAPLPGWETCIATPPSWIYTPWNMNCRKSTPATDYEYARSVVSCSSAICACLDPQTISGTCTYGTDCPFNIVGPTPTPSCP
jgi:hypothetical protein